MHSSVVKKEDDIQPAVAYESTGAERYQCPLCPSSRVRPGGRRKLQSHLDEVHLQKAFPWQGWLMLPCNLACKESTHIHCPQCGNAFSKAAIRQHLSTCEAKKNMSKEDHSVHRKAVESKRKGGEKSIIDVHSPKPVQQPSDEKRVHTGTSSIEGEKKTPEKSGKTEIKKSGRPRKQQLRRAPDAEEKGHGIVSCSTPGSALKPAARGRGRPRKSSAADTVAEHKHDKERNMVSKESNREENVVSKGSNRDLCLVMEVEEARGDEGKEESSTGQVNHLHEDSDEDLYEDSNSSEPSSHHKSTNKKKSAVKKGIKKNSKKHPSIGEKKRKSECSSEQISENISHVILDKSKSPVKNKVIESKCPVDEAVISSEIISEGAKEERKQQEQVNQIRRWLQNVKLQFKLKKSASLPNKKHLSFIEATTDTSFEHFVQGEKVKKPQCLLCANIRKYDPTKKLWNVRNHFRNTHIAYRILYGDMTILSCRLACEGNQAGNHAHLDHWHCPHCPAMFYLQPRLLAHLGQHIDGSLPAELDNADLQGSAEEAAEQAQQQQMQEIANSNNTSEEAGDNHDHTTPCLDDSKMSKDEVTDADNGQNSKGQQWKKEVFQAVVAELSGDIVEALPSNKQAFFQSLEGKTGVSCDLVENNWTLRGRWQPMTQAQKLLEELLLENVSVLPDKLDVPETKKPLTRKRKLPAPNLEVPRKRERRKSRKLKEYEEIVKDVFDNEEKDDKPQHDETVISDSEDPDWLIHQAGSQLSRNMEKSDQQYSVSETVEEEVRNESAQSQLTVDFISKNNLSGDTDSFLDTQGQEEVLTSSCKEDLQESEPVTSDVYAQSTEENVASKEHSMDVTESVPVETAITPDASQVSTQGSEVPTNGTNSELSAGVPLPEKGQTVTLKEVILNDQISVTKKVSNEKISTGVVSLIISPSDEPDIKAEAATEKSDNDKFGLSVDDLDFDYPLKPGRKPRGVKIDPFQFDCSFCGKKFKRNCKLMYHKMYTKCRLKAPAEEMEKLEKVMKDVETNVKGTVCPLCHKRFKRLDEARLHYLDRICQKRNNYHNPSGFVRGPNGYLCPEESCGYVAPKVSLVTLHVRQHHTEKVFDCPKCGRKFGLEIELKAHMKWTHVAKTVMRKCEKCNEEVSVRDFRKHMKYKHDPKFIGKKAYKKLDYDLICEFCPYMTRHKALLYRHINRHHTPDVVHPCEICGKKFKLKEELKVHSIVHDETLRLKNSVSCEICGKSMLKKNVQNHMKTVHEKQKNFFCSICNKAFSTKALKLNHEDTHYPESQRMYKFYCQYCRKGFHHKMACEDHENMHTGNKSHSCDICNKRFKYGTSLTRHRELHGNPEYNCDLCSKVFTSPRLLNEHRVRHENTKQYVCVCGKVYLSATGMTHHQNQCPLAQLRKQELQEQVEQGQPEAGSTAVTVIIPEGEHGDQQVTQVDLAGLQEVMSTHKEVTILVDKPEDLLSSMMAQGIETYADGEHAGVQDVAYNAVALTTEVQDGTEAATDTEGHEDVTQEGAVTETGMEEVREEVGASLETEGGYQCGYCQVVLTSLQDVQAHMLQQHVHTEQVEVQEIEAGDVETSTETAMAAGVSTSPSLEDSQRAEVKLEEGEEVHAQVIDEDGQAVHYLTQAPDGSNENIVLSTQDGVATVIACDAAVLEGDDGGQGVRMSDQYAASLLAAIHAGDATLNVVEQSAEAEGENSP